MDEPGAVRPNIYASTRLARTQRSLPLNAYSTSVMLPRLGRRSAEPRDASLALPPPSRSGEYAFFGTTARTPLGLEVPFKIGSDSLMSGPQTLFGRIFKDFKSATVRNIKGCVGNFSVRACFFKKIGQFFGRARRSDVTGLVSKS